MFRFVCQAYDGGSNPIDGGCGEVDFAIIGLKHCLGKNGEDGEISLSKNGDFSFTKRQLGKIPKEKSPEEIIELISNWSDKGKFLYFAGCPNDGCKHHIKIYHLEAKDGV